MEFSSSRKTFWSSVKLPRSRITWRPRSPSTPISPQKRLRLRKTSTASLKILTGRCAPWKTCRANRITTPEVLRVQILIKLNSRAFRKLTSRNWIPRRNRSKQRSASTRAKYGMLLSGIHPPWGRSTLLKMSLLSKPPQTHRLIEEECQSETPQLKILKRRTFSPRLVPIW